MLKNCFLLLFVTLCGCIAAQQRTFDVVLLGSKIGQTTIVKKVDGKGTCTYKLHSSSSAKVLFTERSSTMDFDVTFVGGKLYSSLCKVVNNGTLAITEIMKDAKGYLIKKEQEVFHVTEPITFSSMELYYTEPSAQPRVFSERMGEFVGFIKTAPGEYMNKLKDVTNIYRYRNGSLYEVEIRKPLGSVYLRARP